ncbi:MAG: radical SAM protein [Clostridia bacterium]|nr:radical SAM protein [Clostridia bacterium]
MSKNVKIENMKLLAQCRNKLWKNPKLTYLFFEITDSCNMSCIHCGSRSSPHNKKFLQYEAVKSVLEDVAARYEADKIMVCLTGGEPMLHPDFYRICKCAKEIGFLCGITTNGTLIDETAAKKIKENGVRSVSISLDGTKDTHEWFRDTSGSYKKTVDGIRNLVKVASTDIAVQVTTVVHKENIKQLDEIYDVVLNAKADSWRLVNMDPIGRARDNAKLLLAKEDYSYLFNYIREKRFSHDVPIHVTYGCSHYLGVDLEGFLRDHYFFCGSGICVGSVLCNGDIFGCLDIERRPELVQGNIFTDSFVDVWENRFDDYRRDRCEDSEECKLCSDREFCVGDSMHTWNFDKRIPEICYKKILE